MSVEAILQELKDTLAENISIHMKASKDAADSLAVINKTQAAISALEGDNKPVPDYPCLQDSALSVIRTGYMQPTPNVPEQPIAEPGFFYDSDGVLRPNGWNTNAPTNGMLANTNDVPAFTLPPIPNDDFADSGDLLGLRG